MSQSPQRQPEVQKAPFPRDFVEILQKKQGKKVTRDFLVGLGIYFTLLDIPASVREVLIGKVDDDHADFEITVEKNKETSAVHTFRFGFKNQSLVATEVVLQESAENDMCFEEVLEELQIDEEELKRLISKAELRGFRTKGGMTFKRKDVLDLKNGTSHEPTIILTDSDQELGGDELHLEDSTSDTVINIGDIMGGQGGSSSQEIIFDTTEEYGEAPDDEDFSRTESLEGRKARIQNLIDIMPDQGLISRETMLDLFNNRVLPAHITCGIVMNGQLFAGAMEMDTSAPIYVYDPEKGDLVMLPAENKKRTRAPNSLAISAMTLVVGMAIGAVLSEKIPFLRHGTTASSSPEADTRRNAECHAILEQAHGFLNPQGLTLEHCDTGLQQWEQAQHPESAKNAAQWRLVRTYVELEGDLQRKMQQFSTTGDAAVLREIDSLLNLGEVTEVDVQRAIEQWSAPGFAAHPNREESLRQWRVSGETLRLKRRIHAFAQQFFQLQ